MLLDERGGVRHDEPGFIARVMMGMEWSRKVRGFALPGLPQVNSTGRAWSPK